MKITIKNNKMIKQTLRPVRMDNDLWELARYKSAYSLGYENRSEYIRNLIKNDKNYKND